jgi:anti-sigma-K factor RskA
MPHADRERHEELARLAELAPLQVLGADEQRLLAEHLDECEHCRERHGEGIDALDALALAGPSVAPREAARRALLAALDATPKAHGTPLRAPLRRGGWRVALPAVAAGVALLLAAGSFFTARRALRDAEEGARRASAQVDAMLDARLAERDERLDGFAARLAGFEDALRRSREEGARAVSLAGEAAFGTASARVVVDRAGNQVLLLASRLPPAPPGRTYQLWVIVSGTPRSLGVFDVDPEGRALHVESEPLGLADDEFSLAISVEPAGGVPQPTGPIVLTSH